MKHLILNGFISPSTAADATEGYVELTDDQAATCALIWANGGAVSAAFDAEFDAAKVAEINGMIAQGFAESPYGAEKAEVAAQAAAVDAKALDYAVRGLKENKGREK